MAVTEAAAKSDEKNILEVCRLCLSDSHLVSFVSKEVADRDLLQKIWFNFRFHIIAIPGSPVPHVCKICIGLVEAFFTYFTRVIENQTYYENLIDNWEKSDFYKYGKGKAERTKEAQQLAKETATVLYPAADAKTGVDDGGTNDKKDGDKKGNVVNGDVNNRPKRPKKRKKVAVVPAPITPLPLQVKPSEFVKELTAIGQQSVNRSSPTLTPKSFYRMPKQNVPLVRCIDNGEEIATTSTQEISLIDAQQPSTSKTSLLLLKNEQNNEQNQLQKSSKSIYHSMIKDAIKPIPKRLTFPSDAQFLPPKQPSPLPVPVNMDIDEVVIEKIDDTVEPKLMEPKPMESPPMEPPPPPIEPPTPLSSTPPLTHVTGDMDEVPPPNIITTPSIITDDMDEVHPPKIIETPSKIPFSGGDGSAFYNYSEKIKLMDDDIDVITLNIITIKREPPDLPTDADGNLIPRQKRKRAKKRRRTDQQNQSQTALPDSPKTVLRKKLDQLMPEYLNVKSDRYSNDVRIKMFYQLTCPICPSVTTEENQENPLPPQHFETFKDILVHCEKIHNEPGYIVCCNRKLYRKDRLLTHLQLHENPDAFKCPDCGHKSQSKPLLRIHMKVHLPLDEGGLRRADGTTRKKRLGRPGISASNSEFNIYPTEHRTMDDVPPTPIESESMVLVKKDQEVNHVIADVEIKQELMDEVMKEVDEQKQVELPQNIIPAEIQQIINSGETPTQSQLQSQPPLSLPPPSQPISVSELPAPVKIEPIENNDNLIDNNTNANKIDVTVEETAKPVKLGRGKYIRVKRPTDKLSPIRKRQKRTSTTTTATTTTTPKAEMAAEPTEETTAEPMAETNATVTSATPATTTKAKIKTKRKPAEEKQELLGEFFCNRCDTKFDKKSHLKLHLVEVHNADPTNPYECNQCKELFADVAVLRAHELAVHGKYSTHICNYCNKEFKLYRGLYSHIRNVHLQVKNFPCNVCDKRFRRRLELAEHMARHSGEALYKCPYCSQTFGARTNYLNHHRKWHKNEQIADILSMLDNSATMAADITTIIEDKSTRKKSLNSLTDFSINDISGSVGGGGGASSSSFSHVTGDDDIDNHYNQQNQNNDTIDGTAIMPPAPMNLYSMPKLLSSEEIVRTVIGPVSCTIVSGENNRLLQINNDGNVKVNVAKQNNIDIDDIETQIDTHVVGDISSRKLTVNNDEIINLTTNNDANVNGNIDAA